MTDEKPHLDLSLKSHSYSKLYEILNKKNDDEQNIMNRNLMATNSLPKINKKLINDIFTTLLINEHEERSSNIKINVETADTTSMEFNNINMITMDRKGKSKKYLSGCSNIKNTGYKLYDVLKNNIDVQVSPCSQIDIISGSGNNLHSLKGFINKNKMKKSKLYGKEEK